MAGRKWLPLAPNSRRDIWTSCSGFIPTRAGAYATQTDYTSVASGPGGTPGTAKRAWCALLVDDTLVTYVGTTTKIYSYSAGTFTDRSRGGGYTNTATDWSFVQFGNRTLAANKIDAMQSRDAAGAVAFADLAGAPKASILVSQALQVLAFDINDGTDQPNAFAICAPGDYTDWSSAGATTATKILHRPGKITAAIAFRDYVLAFKQSSVYKLTYTGGTFKWRVECIAIGRGAWGKHDVVHCGDSVVFSGPGGAWKFDGSSFSPLTDEFGEIARSIGSYFAPLSQNVWFFTGTRWFVYSLVGNAWGQSMASLVLASAVPMTGETSALAALVSPTSILPDLHYVLDTVALGVSKNSVYWHDTFSLNNTAFIGGSVDGIGGDRVTRFGELTPRFIRTLPYTGGTVTVPDTSLTLDVYVGYTVDSANLTNNVTTGPNGSKSITDRASHSKSRRFAVNLSAPYAMAIIKAPGGSGHAEILDYDLGMTPDGKQGA